MHQFFGTFGTGHSLCDKYQPILANTLEQAEKIMLETHGREWASVYTEEKFHQIRQQGIFLKLESLPII